MSKQLLFTFFLVIFFSGCDKDNATVDTEYPVINISGTEAFPVQCSEMHKGQTIRFICDFSDNVELGSFSLDIHHNFDHHTHSTEVNDCAMDPVKMPVKPFLFLKSFAIPENNKVYKADVLITIPNDVDTGDYHLMIMLTDREGWQSVKGLSIKIK